jgi:hypothetical protein
VLLGLSMAAGTAALILAFGICMYLGVCVYGVVLVPVVAFWLSGFSLSLLSHRCWNQKYVRCRGMLGVSGRGRIE